MRMAMMNIKIYNNNYSTRLKQDKWYNFSFVLRKKDRMLFEEMLQSSCKYSSSINSKGNEYSTEPLFITLIFEQYKKLIFNSNHNQHQQHQQQLFK
jgi:hypothetical protein